MIPIKPSVVPEYLRSSAFFANLGDDENEEEVSVPKDCCKLDRTVTNQTDLEELILTLRFWGVDHIPESIVHFLLSNDRVVWEPVITSYVADLASLAQLIQILDCKREHQVCEAALLRNANFVTCLLNHGYPAEYRIFSFCSELKRAVDIVGDLSILKILSLHNCQNSEETGKAAALGGHYECFQYLMQNGCPVAEDLVNFAFAGGSVECLSFAHETLECMWTNNLFSELQFLTLNSPYDELSRVRCLNYAQAHGCPHDPDACYTCALLGLPSLLQQLHEHGWPWNEKIIYRAALRGHLSCLQYAMEHDCPVPDDVVCAAVLSGRVDTIQYLYDRGLPWPEEPLFLLSNEFIYNMGNVPESLAFAYKLGCPRDPKACYFASKHGWVEILKDGYLHGCAVDVVCTRQAAGHGRLDCLKYLHEIGCPWDEHTAAGAVISKHYGCLEYLIQHSCPVSQVTMRKYSAVLQQSAQLGGP